MPGDAENHMADKSFQSDSVQVSHKCHIGVIVVIQVSSTIRNISIWNEPLVEGFCALSMNDWMD